MNNIMTRSISFIFILLYLSSCGFSPMYKISESNIDFKSYSIKMMNESSISREAKEEIRKSFPSSSEVSKDYLIEVNTTENLDPLITNTDGTVAKYRIEIVMNFKVKDKKNDSYLIEDIVRGFAQYTIETSEIESNEKKNRMTRIATNNAIQMMFSKIQSDTSITNDN